VIFATTVYRVTEVITKSNPIIFSIDEESNYDTEELGLKFETEKFFWAIAMTDANEELIIRHDPKFVDFIFRAWKNVNGMWTTSH
jgi:hypothetical protein